MREEIHVETQLVQAMSRQAKAPVSRKTIANLVAAKAYAISARANIIDYAKKHRLLSVADFLLAFGRVRTTNIANEYLHLMGDLNAKWNAGLGAYMLRRINENLLQNGIIKAGHLSSNDGSGLHPGTYAMLDPLAVGFNGKSFMSFVKMSVRVHKFGLVKNALQAQIDKLDGPLLGGSGGARVKKKLSPAARAKRMRMLVVSALKNAVKVNTINAGKTSYLGAVQGGHPFSAESESALAEREALEHYGLMNAGNLAAAQLEAARHAAFYGEVKAYKHALKRKADPLEQVHVQTAAAISEATRVFSPKKKHKNETKAQLMKRLGAKYRKLGLTKAQASAKAAKAAKALLRKQEKAYFGNQILKFSTMSHVKPVSKLPKEFSKRAQKVELSSALKKVGQATRAKYAKLGLKGKKLEAMVRAAETKASKRVMAQMQQKKAMKVARQQAARLGVDAKIDSMNHASAAEKILRKKALKPKKLTVVEQLKKVADIMGALKTKSGILVKQNAALQDQVSKLSAQVAKVPTLQHQVASLRAKFEVKTKAFGTTAAVATAAPAAPAAPVAPVAPVAAPAAAAPAVQQLAVQPLQ